MPTYLVEFVQNYQLEQLAHGRIVDDIEAWAILGLTEQEADEFMAAIDGA